MKFRSIAVVIACLTSLCVAAPKFTSTSAKQASSAYKQNLDNARSQYIRDLQQALTQAAASSDLNEVQLIAEEIKRLKTTTRPDVDASGNERFTRDSVSGRAALFMYPGGSREITFEPSGKCWPAQSIEQTWRVNDNGALELLDENGKPGTRWDGAFALPNAQQYSISGFLLRKEFWPHILVWK